MTFGDMGFYAIRNPYDVPYLPLKIVPLILNHPAYRCYLKLFREIGQKLCVLGPKRILMPMDEIFLNSF